MYTSHRKFWNWKFVGKILGVGASLATIIGTIVLWHDRPETRASASDAPPNVATIDNDVSGNGNTTRIDQSTRIEAGVHIEVETGIRYPEPSEDEIKQALLDSLRRFGATEKGPDTLVVANASWVFRCNS
jgi:hypothetical protein